MDAMNEALQISVDIAALAPALKAFGEVLLWSAGIVAVGQCLAAWIGRAKA